jgi:hypothetical protein
MKLSHTFLAFMSRFGRLYLHDDAYARASAGNPEENAGVVSRWSSETTVQVLPGGCPLRAKMR